MTEQSLRDDFARRLASGIPFQEKTAVDAANIPIGFSHIGKQLWAAPGKAQIWMLIDPDHRGRGVGEALLKDAVEWARQNALPELYATVRDNDPASLMFATHRGFAVERHRFVSALEVAAFDETPFLPILAEKWAGGIRFASLAEIGDTDGNRRKLYELNCLAGLDEPSSDGSIPSFEEFSRMVFGANWFRADGQILALDGDRFIGLAAVGHNRDSDTMFNAFTGTHPEYRGRKIALALKLRTIRLAREIGVARIRTNNDSLNPAMLAINDKLGYLRQPGNYRLKRVIYSSSSSISSIAPEESV